jgi:hypothetical protein
MKILNCSIWITNFLAFILLGDAFAGYDPGQGLVKGKSPVPYSALAKPAKGQTVTDPDFGTKITRITDAQTDWGATVAVPVYPTIQAWNADESLLFIYVTSPFKGWGLFDGKTYAFKKWLDINPPDVEQVYWSTTDPALLYYIDNNTNYYALTQLNVSTGIKTVLHNFSADLTAGGVLHSCANSSAKIGGGEDPFFMSYANDLIGLGCYLGKNGTGGSAAFGAFSYRISTNTIGALLTVEADVPQALPSGTGTYFYDNTSSVSVLDAATNTVKRTIAFDGSNHSDMLKSGNGDDLVAGCQFDGPSGSGTLMVANLSKGGSVKTIIGEAKGDPYPPTGTLVSGKSWQNPGWVAVAITGCPSGTNGNCNGYNPSAAANPQTYLDQEILVANVDSGTVYRAAHHRTTGNYSNASNSNYWAQPNLVLSPSGTRILFASDWGAANPKSVTVNGNAPVDVYVLELPCYATAVKASGRSFNIGISGLRLYTSMVNRTLNLVYDLGSSGNVTIELFNASGVRIKTLVDGYRQSGMHTETLHNVFLVPGSYCCRFTQGSFVTARKLVVRE